MNLLQALEQNSTITNTKGGEYYQSTFDANLDLFCAVSRYMTCDELFAIFNAAYKENRNLAVMNLLYLLDIREGKGERRIFKLLFKQLININKDDALIVLNLIAKLGRYDYILEGLKTDIEVEVINLIKKQLALDLKSDNPSLLAKWLPSHRTHNKTNLLAKYLINKLEMDEKGYRRMLGSLRMKLNIVEKNLSNKTYEKIIFEEVPAKAMLKYAVAFKNHKAEEYNLYKSQVKNNTKTINTKGLFCYEVIKKLYSGYDKELLDLMWNNQKEITTNNKNILVVADTSGSMTCPDNIPIASAIGLAIYTAQRNNGIFKDRFITFSNKPTFQLIKGETIWEKVINIKSIVANTDIDKVFKLILDTCVNNNIKNDELPSHIVIISDMEFDRGVYSKDGTNFSGWKKAYSDVGYQLPKIVFWNVAADISGVPITKHDKDCVMVSGFSTNLLENLFTLENYNPIQLMLETLEKYRIYLVS